MGVPLVVPLYSLIKRIEFHLILFDLRLGLFAVKHWFSVK